MEQMSQFYKIKKYKIRSLARPRERERRGIFNALEGK
jgi:hypothetical protein